MDTAMKFLRAGLVTTFCLVLVLALEHAHRLKESTKAWIQLVYVVGMFTLGPMWIAQGEIGIEAIAKMLVLVFGMVGLNYVLHPPTGPDDSMDIG